MERTIKLLVTIFLSVGLCAQAADLYYDANGSTAGFGTDVSPLTVDFTAATWTADTNGLSGHTTVSANDVLHFGLEGSGTRLFNWQNYAGTAIGGIHTYQTSGSTAVIERFQKAGGGLELLEWSDGATFQTDLGCGFFWDFGTTGDFVKTGSEWISFDDGGSKLDGMLTISNGFIVLRNTGTVTTNSDFHMVDGGLRILGDLAATFNIGVLSGTGSVTVDGDGNLWDTDISSMGVNMTNGVATDHIQLDYGASLAFNASAESHLDITKSGDVTFADHVSILWGSQTMTFGGSLSINLLADSEPPHIGDTFQLFSARLDENGSFAGSFDSLTLPVLPGGLVFDTSALASAGTITVVAGETVATDLYFDANGTAAGFGTDTSPLTVDFTAATWTTDTNGITGHTTVSVYDVLHFGLEGSGSIIFNWQNYGDIPISGIHTYQTAGSTAEIERFQKAGGGLEQLEWAPGAVFETEAPCSLWWDFATIGNVVKTGDGWLAFADGQPKLGGVMTISNGFVVVRNVGTVNENSHFHMINGGLRFSAGLSGTATVGTISGNGTIETDGDGSLADLLINSQGGVDTLNGSVGDTITFGWGASATLASGAAARLEIGKIDGTNYSDRVLVDWPDKSLTLGGDLEITLLESSESLAIGDTFELLGNTNALAGQFEAITLPQLPGALVFDTNSLSSAGTITVVQGDFALLYEAWAQSFGLTGAAAALTNDVEPDGLDNLLEYALGGNPTSDDAASVSPTVNVSLDGNWFSYVHNERTDDPTLDFSVEARLDLTAGTWETNGVEFVGESPVVDGLKTVTNRTDIGSAEFMRLRVEKD